jgi:oligosaccharide repeat unit polymerase
MLIGNLMILFVLYEQISNDVLFNPRAFFLKEHSLRPIYNVCLAVYPLLLVYVGIRFISKKSIKNGIIFSIHFILSFFLGTRTSLLEPLLILVVLFYGTSAEFFTLKRVVGVGAIFLFLTFASVLLRSGSGAKTMNFERDFFHGNTYSDNRDFGWILDKWSGQYLYGRTYIAGAMSLVPRKYSKFREKWAIGIYTSKVIGYNYKYFAGLRLGFFGEMFINFGLVGVIFLGMLLGFILRKMDHFLKKIFSTNQKDVTKAYSGLFVWNFILCLNVSNNFGALYSLIIILFILSLMRQVSTIVNKKSIVITT